MILATRGVEQMANDFVTEQLTIAMDIEELKIVHQRLVSMASQHKSLFLDEAVMHIAQAIGLLVERARVL